MGFGFRFVASSWFWGPSSRFTTSPKYRSCSAQSVCSQSLLRRLCLRLLLGFLYSSLLIFANDDFGYLVPGTPSNGETFASSSFGAFTCLPIAVSLVHDDVFDRWEVVGKVCSVQGRICVYERWAGCTRVVAMMEVIPRVGCHRMYGWIELEGSRNYKGVHRMRRLSNVSDASAVGKA